MVLFTFLQQFEVPIPGHTSLSHIRFYNVGADIAVFRYDDRTQDAFFNVGPVATFFPFVLKTVFFEDACQDPPVDRA
jgi:hypothetical protein